MYGDVDLRNASRGIVQGPDASFDPRIQSTGGFMMNGYRRKVPVPMMLQVVDSPGPPRGGGAGADRARTDWIKLYATLQFPSPPTADGDSSNFYAEEVAASWARLTGRDTRSLVTLWRRGIAQLLNAGVDSLSTGFY